MCSFCNAVQWLRSADTIRIPILQSQSAARERLDACICRLDFFTDIVDLDSTININGGLASKNRKGVCELDSPDAGKEVKKPDSPDAFQLMREKKCEQLQEETEELIDTYDDAEEYRKYMEPLFLEELKCNLFRSKGEMDTEMRFMVQKSMTPPTPENKARGLPFMTIELQREAAAAPAGDNSFRKAFDANNLVTGDVVLLSNDRDCLKKEQVEPGAILRQNNAVAQQQAAAAAAAQPASETKQALNQRRNIGTETAYGLCIVQQCYQDLVLLRFFVRPDREQSNWAFARAAANKRSGGGFWCAKVDALSTFYREWVAMHALEQMPVRGYLLNWSSNCETDPAEEKPMRIAKRLQEQLESRFERNQLKAINACRKPKGITLVQGPPGTGKSTTILGIISVLINAIVERKALISGGRGAEEAELAKLPLWLRRRRERELKALEEAEAEAGDAGASGDVDMAADEEGQGAAEGQHADEPFLRKQKTYQLLSPAENLEILMQNQPWMGYHAAAGARYRPWMDDDANDVSGGLSIRDYVKLPSSQIKSMNRIVEEEEHKYSKVLVCAPSNAAIDEIVKRLTTEGITGRDGNPFIPNVIRLGPGVHESLRKFSLEYVSGNRALAKGLGVVSGPELDPIKREILQEANVVCATCSVAGSRDVLNFGAAFESVVIDEAAQGVEVSTLVPLQAGCKRLILVGDPKQLPATVFSGIAKQKGYDRSLFQRLMEDGYPVEHLSMQYRMHPAISEFPSQAFYEGLLTDYRNRQEFEAHFVAPWHELPEFGPLTFFDLPQSAMRVEKVSYVNEQEADFVIALYRILVQLYPKRDWRNELGVISPYDQQVKLIRRKFQQLFGISGQTTCPVAVKTVDGFQGSEKEVIIFSLVRAGMREKDKDGNVIMKKGGLGFAADKRRMNVAMTRARRSLFVVGNSPTIKFKYRLSTTPSASCWEKFLLHCQEKDCFFEVADVEREMPRRIRLFLRNNRDQVPSVSVREMLEKKEKMLESQSPRERAAQQIKQARATKMKRPRAASTDEHLDEEIDYLKMQVHDVPWLANFLDEAADATIDPAKDLNPKTVEEHFRLTDEDISTLVQKQKEEEKMHQTEAEFERELSLLEKVKIEKRQKADEELARIQKNEMMKREAEEGLRGLDMIEEEGGGDDRAGLDDGAENPEAEAGDDDDEGGD
eukprot:g599.t1